MRTPGPEWADWKRFIECFLNKKERILQNGDINLPYNDNAFATILCSPWGGTKKH